MIARAGELMSKNIGAGQAPGIPAVFTLPLFVLTIFSSAALLFSVQPMFTKMVLPNLGGSPGVWSVAMVVFQSLLLAGYAYAHALNRWLPGLPGIALHLAVTLAAAATLPFAIGAGGAPPAQGETFYLIGLFITVIGPSFFALSANGPLLQAWFIHSRHQSAHDPYFLYAASNVGSFLALFAYPFLLEPLLSLGQQRQYWTIGYYGLAVLIAACGALVAKQWTHTGASHAANSDDGRITVWRVLGWIALSAVPSGLLVAVTQQVSTDIASAPLLWVIPLAIYLASFVIVFQQRPVIPHIWMVYIQPVLAAAVIAITVLEIVDNIALLLATHLLAFFVTAMVCHGELVQRRPAARHLTGFYLAMSLGGMLGGMFCGLIAPVVFSWIAEYPLLLVLSLLCRPGIPFGYAVRKPLFALAAIVAITTLAACYFLFGAIKLTTWQPLQMWIVFGLLVAALALCLERLRLAVLITACFLIMQYFPGDGRARETVRSFFGVHKISESPDGRFRILAHGTTIHGAQKIRDEKGALLSGRPEPMSYYFDGGPIAQSVRSVRELTGGPIRIGIVGLGSGAMMCHSSPGDDFRYFEIDADVVRIAKNPKWFTYLSQCGPDAPIVMGDARLTIANEPDGFYDALLIDAFSSDAIPVHLMTKEAVALFKTKLKPRGLLIMHVSNRHMELASEVAAVAAANGMVTASEDISEEEMGANSEEYKFDSTVAIAANAEADLTPILKQKGWELLTPSSRQRVWTDDYSNILGAIIRHWRAARDDDDD